MEVLDDLRLPVVLQGDAELRLGLGEHEPVTVVVVTDVLLVEVGIGAGVGRPGGLVEVVPDPLGAVRALRRDDEQHDVVEDLRDGRGLLVREPVEDVGDDLRRADLGGVDGRLQQVDRPALRGEFPGLRLGQPARVGEPPVDLLDPVELGQVGRRADGEHRERLPGGRLADLLVEHPLGPVGDELVVPDHVGPAGEPPLAAQREAEELLGCGDAWCGVCGGTRDEATADGQGQGKEGGRG